MSDTATTAQLTRAMDGIEQARLGLLEAAKALDEAGIDVLLHRDVLFAMDETRTFQARLTEHVEIDGGH